MIYTLTLNPSLDYIVNLAKFDLGKINRTISEKILAGGKGLNVSMVLKNLGLESIALGFIGGFTGEEIEKRMAEYGCKTDFIKLKNGLSRINVKIKAEEESEINAQGADITDEEVKSLFEKLDKLKANDILVLAGSIPKTVPNDIYEKIMEFLKDRKIDIVVDTSNGI